MPTFSSEKSSLLWDATAIPNAFFCEYMPTAPEGHVKVYLYGYMYAHHVSGEDVLLLSDVAKALSMEESDVLQAFRYWERRRLLQRVQDNPPQFRFLNLQQTLMSKQAAPQDDAYMHFAQALYAIFGEKRKLHGNETVLAYEWVEQLNIPGEVVLMMIQHLVQTRGVHFSFKEAQKLALELCEQQVHSLEAAEQIFSRSEAAWKGAQKVLRRMGKYRAPSLDEIDLYLKWTGGWKFAPKAIESACVEMTGGDPSFKYLDRILHGLQERSGRASTSAAQMEKQLAQEKEETALIREMLAACGMKAPIVDEGKRLVYRHMRELGSHEIIMLAAGEVSRGRGTPSLDRVAELLSAWHQKGLLSAEAVRTYLGTVQAQNSLLKDLYQSAGREKNPTLSDRTLLLKWQGDWHFTNPLLHLAAEYSANAGKPLLFMDSILKSWQEKGIVTLEAARRDHENHQAAGKAAANDKKASFPKGGKTVPEQQYSQRTYDPAKHSGLTAEEIEEMKNL